MKATNRNISKEAAIIQKGHPDLSYKECIEIAKSMYAEAYMLGIIDDVECDCEWETINLGHGKKCIKTCKE